MNEPISRAAALMNKNKVGAVFVTGPGGELMGIVTDHDLRERVVAGSVDYSAPVRSVMTAPVASITAESPLYEALLRMQDRSVDHLAILDDAGALTGFVRLRDLVHYQSSSSVIITDSVRRARSVGDIVEAHDKLPSLVKAVVDSEADTRYINRIISGVSDVVVQRLLAWRWSRSDRHRLDSPSWRSAARAGRNRPYSPTRTTPSSMKILIPTGPRRWPSTSSTSALSCATGLTRWATPTAKVACGPRTRGGTSLSRCGGHTSPIGSTTPVRRNSSSSTCSSTSAVWRRATHRPFTPPSRV